MTTETKHTAGPWAVLQEECDKPYIRVRAALEMAREYASTALDEEREKFRGYEDIGMVASIQADLDSITDSLAALAEIERELDDERRKAAGFKWLLDQQRGVVEECDELRAKLAMVCRAVDTPENSQIGDVLARLHALQATEAKFAEIEREFSDQVQVSARLASERACEMIRADKAERERDELRAEAERDRADAWQRVAELEQRIEDIESQPAEGMIARLEQERDEWIGCHARLHRGAGDLLAIIHRDGGHYIQQHGMDKALADAEQRIYDERGALDAMTAERDELRAKLAEIERHHQFTPADNYADLLRDDGENSRMRTKLAMQTAWLYAESGDIRGVKCSVLRHHGDRHFTITARSVELLADHESPDAALRMCALRVAAQMGERM